MAVVFYPGQTLGQDDLKISIRDSGGQYVDPFYIRYSLFDNTTGVEVLIGAPDRIPATTGTGMFYVNATLPLDANIGDWVVRWNFRETAISPLVQVAQEFGLVKIEVIKSITGNDTGDLLLRRLRILLRDFHPDRNYRFRPPSSEKFLQAQAQVFGYLWEDEELYEFVLMAIDDFNTAPPVTGIDINNMPDRWRTTLLMRAAGMACGAMTVNQIADEFNYSISGVSLSIERSSKYESMKRNFYEEADKSRDLAQRSIKIIKGLKQARYGVGISSALGPYSKPGTQSRRNFAGGGGGGWS
jgi:hypothetical protein